MKCINKNKLFSFLFLLIISNITLAQGYGYYPPSYGYAYPPQYHYPPPPVVYGYPYYPTLRAYPAQQQTPVATTTSPKPVKKAPAATPIAIAQPKNPNQKLKTESSFSSSVKKQKFIELLLPHINRENQKILSDRQWLNEISSKIVSHGELSQPDNKKLNDLSKAYKIASDVTPTAVLINQLLKRVDIIPSSLTLAQAANETGWGTSRFAQQANNYFGIWTYEADKGLKPRNRAAGKTHYVRKFSSPAESVRYYMKLLNTHPAYRELRNIRFTLREGSTKISGIELAQGLEKYSAKGTEYIKLITLLITQNQWAKLDTDSQTASS
jgi:Bax protein